VLHEIHEQKTVAEKIKKQVKNGSGFGMLQPVAYVLRRRFYIFMKP
jgi:hypothetical protein